PLIPDFFFFNIPATPEIYTLSLHDALPICELHATSSEVVINNRQRCGTEADGCVAGGIGETEADGFIELSGGVVGDLHIKGRVRDRKSTRLNSSHDQISYAVFCLKKKKKTK